MVKQKQTDKGSQEEEWISKLPNLLISDNILSRLSTKDAVRTSALSTQWRNLWKSVPGLNLHSLEFLDTEAFVDFVDRFFDSHKESWIRKLQLSIPDSDDITKSRLSSWIDVVIKRRIQQLDVCFFEIPMSIYTCETLVQLKLSWANLAHPEFVYLPCLKIMYLRRVRYLNDDSDATTVEKLISGSPVLEDLTIIGCFYTYRNVIQVRSKTLKRIQIDRFIEVVIDAPLLQCLKTMIFCKKNFKIITSGFPAKLDIQLISTMFDKPAVSEILTDISKVRELVINEVMWKGIYLYSKLEPLIQFRYLSRLSATYYKSDLELLPTLLESCPNLQSLILFQDWSVIYNREEKEPNVVFSTVPQCLVSSLKFVELKCSTRNSDFEGETELVRYLLKNSTILEKLRLENYHRKKEKCDILKELLAMPRCSISCEVLIS